jgi:hypothetical protein
LFANSLSPSGKLAGFFCRFENCPIDAEQLAAYRQKERERQKAMLARKLSV